MDQWNRIEDPEMNLHTYGHLIFDKVEENIQWKKDSLSTNGAGSTGGQHVRMQIDSYLLVLSSTPKWIKDVHIKPDTQKLIETKLGKTLEDMGTGEKFLNRTSIAYALRSRIDKWDLIKLQSFCKAKHIVKR